MMEQEELINSTRRDYEMLQQEMNRTQAENESSKEEAKDVLQALEELAVNYDQKSQEVEAKNRDLESAAEELAQSKSQLNNVMSEFAQVRNQDFHFKKCNKSICLFLAERHSGSSAPEIHGLVVEPLQRFERDGRRVRCGSKELAPVV